MPTQPIQNLLALTRSATRSPMESDFTPHGMMVQRHADGGGVRMSLPIGASVNGKVYNLPLIHPLLQPTGGIIANQQALPSTTASTNSASPVNPAVIQPSGGMVVPGAGGTSDGNNGVVTGSNDPAANSPVVTTDANGNVVVTASSKWWLGAAGAVGLYLLFKR